MTVSVPPALPSVIPSATPYFGVSTHRDDLLRNKHVHKQEGVIQPRPTHPDRFVDSVATVIQESVTEPLSNARCSETRRRRAEENSSSSILRAYDPSDGSPGPPRRNCRGNPVDPKQLFTSRWIQRNDPGKRSMELMVARVPNTVEYFNVSTPADIDVSALYKRERRAVDNFREYRDNLTNKGSLTCRDDADVTDDLPNVEGRFLEIPDGPEIESKTGSRDSLDRSLHVRNSSERMSVRGTGRNTAQTSVYGNLDREEKERRTRRRVKIDWMKEETGSRLKSLIELEPQPVTTAEESSSILTAEEVENA